MSVIRIASRYAKSLLDLAKEQNSVDQVLSDIQFFNKAIENRDLLLLVKSPIVSISKKKTIFKEIFGNKFSKLTLAFFDIILNKGREPYLPQIGNEFVTQYNSFKGISKVQITTAQPISDEALEDIKAKLASSDLTAESITFEKIVDPDIIGGIIIKVGDKLYDASIQRKLKELRKDFSNNKYVKAY